MIYRWLDSKRKLSHLRGYTGKASDQRTLKISKSSELSDSVDFLLSQDDLEHDGDLNVKSELSTSKNQISVSIDSLKDSRFNASGIIDNVGVYRIEGRRRRKFDPDNYKLKISSISSVFRNSPTPYWKPWMGDKITKFFGSYLWLDPFYLLRIILFSPIILLFSMLKRIILGFFTKVWSLTDNDRPRGSEEVYLYMPPKYSDFPPILENLLGWIGLRSLTKTFNRVGIKSRKDFFAMNASAIAALDSVSDQDKIILMEFQRQGRILKYNQTEIADKLLSTIYDYSVHRLQHSFTLPFIGGSRFDRLINETVDLVYMDFLVSAYTGSYLFLPPKHWWYFGWWKKYHYADLDYEFDVHPHLLVVKQLVRNKIWSHRHRIFLKTLMSFLIKVFIEALHHVRGIFMD